MEGMPLLAESHREGRQGACGEERGGKRRASEKREVHEAMHNHLVELGAGELEGGGMKGATSPSLLGRGVGGGSGSRFSPSTALHVNAGSIPYWLCDMGQVDLCLCLVLFKMELLWQVNSWRSALHTGKCPH